MANFDFYNIEQLIQDGVSDELLRKIVAEANRFKVLQKCRLDQALEGQQTVILSGNYPHKWNDELDAFVDANLVESGRFRTGDTVIRYHASKDACDWYKSFIGLEARIINSWEIKPNQRKYEIEIAWNKHKAVAAEHELIAIGSYDKPWWCREATKASYNKLYVELQDFSVAEKLLNELSDFAKGMSDYGESVLHLTASRFDTRFTIIYKNRLSFLLQGQRSSRCAVLKTLKRIQQQKG